MIYLWVLVVCAATANCSNVFQLPSDRRVASNLRSRIVGGRQATIEQFPYQVSILHSRAHICGGSILKPDIVITAAHCLIDVSTENLAIVAGATDWGEDGVESAVKGFVMHQRFSPDTFDYDIAMMKLVKKLSFGPSIQPIRLPKYRQEFRAGSVGVVSGWGALGENDHDPDELQFTTMKVINFQECSKAYRNIHPVTRSMMCAWIKDGGQGTCQGDSGGALVIGNVMAGIVSWGLGCARPNVPDVYTKVSVVRRWLDIQLEALK